MTTKMDADEKYVPIELFLEVLEKYKESTIGLIWERSIQRTDDLKELDEEINKYKKLAGVKNEKTSNSCS